MTEEWKDISGFEGWYMVSNLGNIKRIMKKNVCELKTLKPYITPAGYPMVKLSKEGKTKRIFIHHMVAQMFIGDRPLKYDINHIDGNPANNYFLNLEYITHRENILHAIKMGKMTKENRKDIKLKDYQVLEIKKKYALGNILQKDLAKEYGVGRPHICQILNNQKRINVKE